MAGESRASTTEMGACASSAAGAACVGSADGAAAGGSDWAAVDTGPFTGTRSQKRQPSSVAS